MRKFLSSLAIAALGWVPLASAQSSIVVVELYTSQGCSSCPAADAILNDIAEDQSIIALGLHVDYWDYLGWKDKLAQHAFTKRQAAYNMAMKSRYRLVTPQMIFQGRDYVAGAKKRKTLEYIEMYRNQPEYAKLQLVRDGDEVRIQLAPNAASRAADLHIVRFNPSVDVEIKGGENRGKTVRYVNTVTRWDTIADWNGRDTLDLSHDLENDDQLAVIVQEKGHGAILAARRLD